MIIGHGPRFSSKCPKHQGDYKGHNQSGGMQTLQAGQSEAKVKCDLGIEIRVLV